MDGNGSNAIKRRYVHGPGEPALANAGDEPLVWYEGSGLGDRRWLHANEQGSIVAVTDASGNVMAINSYNEYGINGAVQYGRFGYTGQAWLPDAGLYWYKTRMYSPTLGRFLQTDTIGYGDGPNMYNYVRGDPGNGSDPMGSFCSQTSATTGLTQAGQQTPCFTDYSSKFFGAPGSYSLAGPDDIVVTATRHSFSFAVGAIPSVGVGASPMIFGQGGTGGADGASKAVTKETKPCSGDPKSFANGGAKFAGFIADYSDNLATGLAGTALFTEGATIPASFATEAVGTGFRFSQLGFQVADGNIRGATQTFTGLVVGVALKRVLDVAGHAIGSKGNVGSEFVKNVGVRLGDVIASLICR